MSIKCVRLTTGEDVIFDEIQHLTTLSYIEMDSPVRIVVQPMDDGTNGVAFVPAFPLNRDSTIKIPRTQLLTEPYAIDSELEQAYASNFGKIWTPSTTPIITG